MGYLFALVGNAHFLVLCLSQVNAHWNVSRYRELILSK